VDAWPTERHDHSPVWAEMDQSGNKDGKVCGSDDHLRAPPWPCKKIQLIDRIEQLEAALLRASIQHIDFDDGREYYRCGACARLGSVRAPHTELRHADDCLYAEITRRALGEEDG
jgi:hypothetical protein